MKTYQQEWNVIFAVCLLAGTVIAVHAQEEKEAPAGVEAGAEPAQQTQAVEVSDPEQERAAREAAEAWVLLTDGNEALESRKQAGKYFKGSVSQPDWRRTLQKIRKPMAKVVSREFDSATVYTQHPAAPRGKIAFVRFNTSFEEKPDAKETVALRLEAGEWKVAGYIIE